MQNFRPYTSVDIETTGLNEKVDVLQIAGVIDNGVDSIDELKTIDIKIKYNKFESAEPFALMLNAGIISDMCNKDLKHEFCEPEEAATKLIEFVREAYATTKEYDKKNDIRMNGKIIFAGKNYAAFDDPKIRKFLSTYAPEILEEYSKLTSYKTLDVGSMYYLDFGYNPSLSQINELTGRTAVTHKALDDALDVVYAVRKKANML